MTAAAANLDTPQKSDGPIARTLPPMPVAASTTIYQGTLVALTLLGYLVPASADPTLRVIGRAEEYVDNSAGSAGAKKCRASRGIFGFANSSSTGAIVDLDVGRFVYAVDDSTVSRTNPIGQYPIAGRVYDVDADGLVYIEVGAHPDQPAGSSDYYIVTAADLSTTGQGRWVALDGSGLLVLAATAGMVAFGGLVNAPTSGAVGIVRRRGPLRMYAEAAIAENVLVAVAVTTGRYKTAVNATCDASIASATAAITGSYVMGTTMEESSGAGDLALIDIHPQGIRPGTLA